MKRLMSASKYLGKEFSIPIVYTMEDRNKFRDRHVVNDRIIVPHGAGFAMAKIREMYPNICLTDKGCFGWTELMLTRERARGNG